MRRLALAFVLALALLLAACGGATTSGGATATGGSPSGSGASTITMDVASFSGNTNVTIKAGESVTFNDPSSSGGTHDLVTGMQGKFSAASGAPTEFASSSGVMFSAGDSKSIAFPNAGTFNITCTIHPSMQATVTVT